MKWVGSDESPSVDERKVSYEKQTQVFSLSFWDRLGSVLERYFSTLTKVY